MNYKKSATRVAFFKKNQPLYSFCINERSLGCFMSEQIFISYRRTGGDVSAKLICEALKNKCFSVFYDYDSLHGGYFDTRIISAIEECEDFILVLPKNGLDRCVNEDDWVRLEILTAIKSGKNIVPIMLDGFAFPRNLPSDISIVSRINAVPFSMPFFDAMIATVIDRMRSRPDASATPVSEKNCVTEAVATPSVEARKAKETCKPEKADLTKLSFTQNGDGYSVSYVGKNDKLVVIPEQYKGCPVTEISEHAFENCEELREVVIPNTVSSIGSNAFSHCINLRDIDLPSGLKIIGKEAFEFCETFSSVVIPEGVTEIGDSAFNFCSSLRSVELPGSLTRIGSFSFGNSEIVSISIPEGITKIDLLAFSGCKMLTDVTISSTVTEIDQSAFFECVALQHLTLGESVKKIHPQAFSGCKALKEVVLPRTVREVGRDAFKGCCPTLKVAYQGNALEWKNMKRGTGAFPLLARKSHL